MSDLSKYTTEELYSMRDKLDDKIKSLCYSKWIHYGVKDVDIVSRLDDKLKFIHLIITLAYRIKCNIDDVFSTTRSWGVFIDNELKKENKIVPMEISPKPFYKYIGAYVKDVVPGRYNWVQSFDLASLYPHIQMELNISPEKLLEDSFLTPELLALRKSLGDTIEERIQNVFDRKVDTSCLKAHGVSMSPSGQFYKTDSVGFLPKILKAMYTERTVVKKRMLALKQELEDLKNS